MNLDHLKDNPQYDLAKTAFKKSLLSTIYPEALNKIYKSFEIFNSLFFGNTLKTPIIAFRDLSKEKSHLNRPVLGTCFEDAPMIFISYSEMEKGLSTTLGILLHEMVHLSGIYNHKTEFYDKTKKICKIAGWKKPDRKLSYCWPNMELTFKFLDCIYK